MGSPVFKVEVDVITYLIRSSQVTPHVDYRWVLTRNCCQANVYHVSYSLYLTLCIIKSSFSIRHS